MNKTAAKSGEPGPARALPITSSRRPRPLREGIRAAEGLRIETPVVIGPRRKTGEGKEGQQDEIHLPGARTERMGQAGRAVNSRRAL